MRKLKIVRPSKARQPQPRTPTYEIVTTLSGSHWVGRSDGDYFQLIERFNDLESAQDFIGYMVWITEAPRRLASH